MMNPIAEANKALQTKALGAFVRTREEHSIRCCICGKVEDNDWALFDDVLDDLYEAGWRYDASNVPEFYGPVCPACSARPLTE